MTHRVYAIKGVVHELAELGLHSDRVDLGYRVDMGMGEGVEELPLRDVLRGFATYEIARSRAVLLKLIFMLLHEHTEYEIGDALAQLRDQESRRGKRGREYSIFDHGIAQGRLDTARGFRDFLIEIQEQMVVS